MSKRGVIIQGSSRSDGDTSSIVKFVSAKTGFEVIDLSIKNIGHFDYEFENRSDDFMPTIRYVINNFDTIVFATPIYWYSMSGIMKSFMDRLSDLLIEEKELGRMLRGKSMAMISCSESPETWESVRMPFEKTAGYLGMIYLGDVHAFVRDGEIPEQVKIDLINFLIHHRVAMN